MEFTADYWIQHLHLQAHPEGGFYKETYRAHETILPVGLPSRFSGERCFSTSIYFLLRSQDRSLFHRIKSDELWYYHAGESLTIYVIETNKIVEHQLGPHIHKGESLQVAIPANSWFGARLKKENSYTLSGCNVAPGFDFNDFEMAEREQLLQEFPQHKEIIHMLTK